MGQSIPIDEIGGLPRNDNQFTVSNLKFELRREAGTLTFDGAFREGRAARFRRSKPGATHEGRVGGAPRGHSQRIRRPL